MRRTALVLVSVAALLAPLGTVGVAASATDRTTVGKRGFTDWQIEKRSYFFSTQKWSPKLKRCITVDLSGDWSFQWKPALDPDAPPRGYRKLKVSNAKMEVFTRAGCSRGSLFKNVNTVQMKQRWIPRWSNESDCKLNPSVSVGLPWAASLSVTPECSDPKLKTGFYGTHPGGGDHYFFQYNDGTSIIIDRETTQFAPFCYGVKGSAVAYVSNSHGSGSDSVPTISKSICTHRDDSHCPGDPDCTHSGVPRTAYRQRTADRARAVLSARYLAPSPR